MNLFACSIFTLLIVPCVANAQESATTTWRVYSTENYSIEYPFGWRLDSIPKLKIQFSLSREAPLEDPFFENVILSIRDPEKKITNLDKQVNLTLKKIEEGYQDSEIKESTRFQHSGLECHKVVFSGRLFSTRVMCEQWYWFLDNKVYMLGFTGDPEQFIEYRETGLRIMNSFQFRRTEEATGQQ